MCATYWLGDSIDIEIANLLSELNDRYIDTTVLDEETTSLGSLLSGDVYPKNKSGIIGIGSGSFTLTYAYWGFLRDEKNVVYNSRSDKVKSSYFWRSAYLNNRGFIVCNGFYESKKNSGGKSTRYLFTYPSEDLIYIASISEKKVALDGSINTYYSLLTTEANSSVSGIHHRMPLVLQKDQLYDWITDTKFSDTLLSSEMPTFSYTEDQKKLLI